MTGLSNRTETYILSSSSSPLNLHCNSETKEEARVVGGVFLPRDGWLVSFYYFCQNENKFFLITKIPSIYKKIMIAQSQRLIS